MSTEIDSIDSNDIDAFYEFTNWIQTSGLWDGRLVTLETAPQFQKEVEARITALFLSLDEDSREFQEMATWLAWMGSTPENQSLIAHDIQHLKFESDQIPMMACSRKSNKNNAPKKKSAASRFWKKHKKVILIGAGVVTVVVVVVVVVVCSGGLAGTAVAGAGAGALDGLTSGSESPSESKPTTHFQPQLDYENTTVVEAPSIAFNDKEFTPETFAQNTQLTDANIAMNGTQFSNPQNIEVSPVVLSYGERIAMFEERRLEAERGQAARLTGREIGSGPYNNYADKAYKTSFTADFISPPPFKEIPLIGYPDQSTIHYHCGINNTFIDVYEGGSCLNQTFDKEFAVQSHWIHGDSLVKGLTMVQLQQISTVCEDIPILLPGSKFPQQAAKMVLAFSNIQKSINYEAENLGKIADLIIQRRNPRLKQAHVTFSNGGYVFCEALKRLTPEQGDTIVVITTGTTAIIDDHLACKVYNIIGDKDWPSIKLNGGMEKLLQPSEKAQIEILPQTETAKIIEGHYFMQPDYQNQVLKIVNEQIMKNYEIY